jgi:uncharacterized protein
VIRVLAPVLLTLVACGQPATSAPTAEATPGYDFPALTGRVVDRADILPSADEARIVAKSDALARATGHQFVVVTVPTLDGHAIEEYSRALGNSWGIGRKGANDGVLLVVAPTERKVRIEVGEGLEATLTNEKAQRIIDTDLVPAFRSGDFVRGIDDGVDGIIRDVGPAGGGA